MSRQSDRDEAFLRACLVEAQKVRDEITKTLASADAVVNKIEAKLFELMMADGKKK